MNGFGEIARCNKTCKTWILNSSSGRNNVEAIHANRVICLSSRNVMSYGHQDFDTCDAFNLWPGFLDP